MRERELQEPNSDFQEKQENLLHRDTQKKTSVPLQPSALKEEAGIGELLRIYNVVNSPRNREMLGMGANLQKTTDKIISPRNHPLGAKPETMTLTKIRSILEKNRGEGLPRAWDKVQTLPRDQRTTHGIALRIRGHSHSNSSGAGQFPTLIKKEEKANRALSVISKPQLYPAIKHKVPSKPVAPLKQRPIGTLASLISPRYRTLINERLSPRRPEEKKEMLTDLGLNDMVSCYVAKTRGGKAAGNIPKTNQDSYVAIRNFCSFQNCWFFGVFDGHGINGEHASDHVKRILPTNLELIDSRYTSQKKQAWTTAPAKAKKKKKKKKKKKLCVET
eukprot:TRINITY_DN65084_c0_g1_i1.p1 TRINITY_DN65084_c0_g1~~TRINITY_DN65084_c0_g1_i1.p1  ORF type:complete len:332 (-),score=45.73 TRINITY_DN65084_c0_g1_i1:149-1144(-)